MIAILCVLCTAGAAQEQESGRPDNLVQNGSFELADAGGFPDRWGRNFPQGRPAPARDTAVAHTGQASAKISATGPARFNFSQTIPVRAGQAYEVSIWVRSERLVPVPAAQLINLIWQSDAGDLSAADVGVPRPGTHDWYQVGGTVRAPQRAIRVRMRLFLHAESGTMWFDDVELREAKEPPAPTEVVPAADVVAIGVLEGPTFFQLLDLDRLGLEHVRAAVVRREYEVAKHALLAYYRQRRTPRWYRNPLGAVGDEAGAARFARDVIEWVTRNPPDPRNGQWVTLRVGSRLWGYAEQFSSAAGSPGFTPEALFRMLSSVWQCAEFLVPEHRFRSGSNWGVAQAGGLFHAALYFPEFKDAPKWQRLTIERLTQELSVQHYPDGGQIELAPIYHKVNARWYGGVVLAARLNGVELPDSFQERVEQIFDFMTYLLKPDLTLPMFGDSRTEDISREMYAKIAVPLFGRADMRYVATKRREGRSPAQTSIAFPDSGFYIMRSDWRPFARYLAFKCGPYGGKRRTNMGVSTHSHYDQLSFILCADGTNYLEDMGVGPYDSPEKDEAKATSNHNAIVVDGKDQNAQDAVAHAWLASSAFDYVDGSHPGYLDATCRRRIWFVKPDFWVLSDIVSGEGTHRADEYFRLTPVRPSVDAEARVVTAPGVGDNTLLMTFLEGTLSTGPGKIIYDFSSNWRGSATVIKCSREGPLPLLFTTLLYPMKQGQPTPQFEYISASGAQVPADGVARAEVVAVRVGVGNAEHVLLFGWDSGEYRCGRVGLVGRACAITVVGGDIRRIGLVDATVLEGMTPSLQCSAPFTGALVKEQAGNWCIENRSDEAVALTISLGDPAAGLQVFRLLQDGQASSVEVEIADGTLTFTSEPGADYLIAEPVAIPLLP